MPATDYSYIGSGKVYIKEFGAAAGLKEVGNCNSLQFAVTEDVKSQLDHTQPGGGTYNEVRRIQAVEATVQMADLSPENFARAFLGASNAIVAAPVSGEVLTSYQDSFLPFAYVPDSAVAPTVVPTNASASARANSQAYVQGDYYTPATPNGFFYKVTTAGTSAASPPTFGTTIGDTTNDGTAVVTCMGKTTLVANTDYEVRSGGIYMLAAAGLEDGETVTCGYTKAAGATVQALINAAKDYALVFDGLNEARSGKSVRVTVYRMKLGAAKNASLIADDYANLEVSGKLQKDSTQSGAGVSQYFRVDMVA